MTNQNRVRAGVRSGGQYATTARSASPVNRTSEQEHVRRIVADTRRAAGYASRATGQDLDDVAGDALLAFAEAHDRGRAWSNLSTGEINTVVPRVAYRRMSGLIRGEEFDAVRQYRTRLGRIEQEEHRTVGDAERDWIAYQVWASMPPPAPTQGRVLPAQPGPCQFLNSQRGFTIPSSATFGKIGAAYVAEVHRWAEAHDVKVVHFAKGENKGEGRPPAAGRGGGGGRRGPGGADRDRAGEGAGVSVLEGQGSGACRASTHGVGPADG